MSGLIGFTGPPDRELAVRMLNRLAHRGAPIGDPYETPDGTVAVCEWPRLQGNGNSCTGYHEFANEVWAVSGIGFPPMPAGPTRQDLVSLRGSFCTAQLTEGKLTIARDPVGCQSLYYGRVGDRWLVATEPKAITMEAEFKRRIRPASLAQYLAFSFVPGRATMLEDLFEAEAGHAIHLKSQGLPEVVPTFRFEEDEWNPHRDGMAAAENHDLWVQRTREHVARAVAERLTGDAPAVFLSGGLDSSIVAAEVARQSPGRIRTFSIHFGAKYPNELGFARAVAERIGSDHEEVLITPRDFLPRLRRMVWHLDEPIGDPITQPNFELAAHVGRDSRFVFNGEGGDPLFGGPKNLPMLLLHWYGDPRRAANFREQAYLASYRRAYQDWSELLTPDVRRQIDPVSDLEGILRPLFAADQPRHFLNKLMSINIRLKGANLILPKVDRMLAAHGMTPLSPLFDDRLTRLSFQMPPRMKLRSGVEKYVLKRAFESELPADVIARPKSGMRVPVHYWFQEEMRRYAASILSRRNVRRAGMFDPDRVQQMLRYESEDGAGRFGIRLWMLMTFEIWRRVVIEGETP